MRAWRGGLLPLLALLLASCAPGVTVSDTGYEGSWQRGNERAVSVISIVRVGDRHRFRWTADSADGNWKVRCDWDGKCREFVGDELTSEYTFRTWENTLTGHMMVECDGVVFRPKEAEIHYLDELVLSEDGLTLWSFSLERHGETYPEGARPRRSFEKISNGVANPPVGAGSAGP